MVFFASASRSWSFFLSFIVKFFAVIPTLMNLVSITSWLLRINKWPRRSTAPTFFTYDTILSLFSWVQFWIAYVIIALVRLLILGLRATALLAVTRRRSLAWFLFLIWHYLFLYFHFVLGCYYFSQVSLLRLYLLFPIFHHGLHFVLSYSYFLQLHYLLLLKVKDYAS